MNWYRSPLTDRVQILSLLGCSPEVLEATAAIGDHVREGSSNQQLDAIDRLERKLVHAKQHVPPAEPSNTIASSSSDNTADVAELYRLAGLIYLYRACKSLPSTSPRVKEAIESGFAILRNLTTCDRPFPLLIIGCEARTDEDRLIVLDLIRRSRAHRKIGNLGVAKRFVEAYWAQSDLDTGDALGYVQKFDAIISASEMLPSFA